MIRSRPPGREALPIGVADVVVVAGDKGIDDPDRWAGLARSVLDAEGVVGPAELALSFVDEATMAELNQRWMGGEGPTDVLSWTIDAPAVDRPLPAVSPAEPVLLGDVVVCPAVAARAVSPGGSLEDELALLVVHGVLHVLGLDHAEAATEAAMQAREALHLTRFHDRRWVRSSS